MMINKWMLKMFLFLFGFFSQSGFVYVMIMNPVFVPLMSISFGLSSVLLLWAVIVLSGGFKKLQGWWAKRMMQAAQRRDREARIRELVEKEMKK